MSVTALAAPPSESSLDNPFDSGVTVVYASLVNTTTVVHFDSKDWYLIDYDSSTVTLLTKECVGASAYNSSASELYVEYASSTVKTAVDNWYSSNISAGAKTAVNGEMFLLTTDQATTVITNAGVRKCSKASGAVDNDWWLCSGYTDNNLNNLAVCVKGTTGEVGMDKMSENYALGVRPALQLDLSKVTFDATSKIFTAKPPHTHSFTYAVGTGDNANAITATCSEDGCGLTDKKTTLTLVKPTLTAYGQTGEGISAAATLTGLDDFNTATCLTVAATDIKYYKATKSGDDYTKGNYLGTTAPTDAGTYLAEITLSGVKTSTSDSGSVTASVGYTIAKAATTITTAPTVGEITYGDTLADSTLTGGEASVDGSFAWKDSTIAPTVADGDSTQYDVVFTPDDANYATATCKVTLTVSKADPAYTVGQLSAFRDQTLADVALPKADNGTWSWEDDTTT